MVSYLVATPIWPYRLRRATDWAWSSVANADAPLAYELAATLAIRRNLHVPPAYEVGIRTVRKSLVFLFLAVLTRGNVGCYINAAVRRYRVQIHRFNKRPASRIRHSAGSNQEYQSRSGSAISLRLLALKVHPVTDQSETKAMAGTMALTWYYQGLTDVRRSLSETFRLRVQSGPFRQTVWDRVSSARAAIDLLASPCPFLANTCLGQPLTRLFQAVIAGREAW